MKIGIVGLGDMGKMFAKRWSAIGFEVCGIDTPKNYEIVCSELLNTNVKVLKSAKDLAQSVDFIMFCVETDNIAAVVEQMAPHIPSNCIVSAQTSVKAPEINAFDKFLNKNIQVIGSHALFGPHVNPEGQTLILFNHNASTEIFESIKKVFETLKVKTEVLANHQEHDKLMADIQVVTHIGFESLGTAFMHRRSFPWETSSKINGIDNIKILLALRIYAYKSHVYAGMAFFNPFAKKEVRKFASTENELFGLMITEGKRKLENKIYRARDKVFGQTSTKRLLNESILDEYTLNPELNHVPNSHLSLLSMLCTWADLGVNPYDNMVCQTPPFRLRVGLVEYLCHNKELLNETIESALYLKSIREDDLAYHTAVHEWANILELGDMKAYEQHFNQTKAFLSPRLAEGLDLSNKLIAKLY